MTYSYQTEKEAVTVNNWAQVRIKDIRDVYVWTLLDWLDVRTEFVDFCMDVLNEVKFINCSEGGILYQQDVIDALDMKVWVRFYLQGKEKGK